MPVLYTQTVCLKGNTVSYGYVHTLIPVILPAMQGGLRMLELRCNDLNNKKGEDMTNTGIPYEKFVKEVYTALQLTKNLPNVSSVDIEHNKHIMDNCGIDRQFDLYWERIEFGETKRSVIECKDYQNGVSIDRVDALIGKMADIPGIVPIMATSHKYQSGALQKAKSNNIELLVVREENLDKDWKTSDGTPCIRTIIGRIVAIQPLRIIGFSSLIDEEIAKRMNIKEGGMWVRNDQVYFGDNTTGKRCNLLELAREMEKEVKGYNTEPKELKRMLDDGYEEVDGVRIPIKGYSVKYIYPPPFVDNFKLEPIVKAVFEYVTKGQKEILMNLAGRDVVKKMSL